MESELFKLAEQLGRYLKANNKTIATAESCTGGWISQVITEVPGSSAWFDRGFVTYSNSAKVQMLNVNPHTLDTYGDVIIRLNRSRGTPITLPKINPHDLGEVHEAINKIHQQLGVTVLLVEQKLPFARKVADRFCIMDRGRNVAVGDMDQLAEDMVKRYLTV